MAIEVVVQIGFYYNINIIIRTIKRNSVIIDNYGISTTIFNDTKGDI